MIKNQNNAPDIPHLKKGALRSGFVTITPQNELDRQFQELLRINTLLMEIIRIKDDAIRRTYAKEFKEHFCMSMIAGVHVKFEIFEAVVLNRLRSEQTNNSI